MVAVVAPARLTVRWICAPSNFAPCHAAERITIVAVVDADLAPVDCCRLSLSPLSTQSGPELAEPLNCRRLAVLKLSA